MLIGKSQRNAFDVLLKVGGNSHLKNTPLRYCFRVPKVKVGHNR